MNSITVSSTSARFRHDITIGSKFHLTVDEPLDVGGDDTGPTPLDLVLAGLGSCQAITLKMYAERKGWELTGVKVEVERHSANRRDQISVCLHLEGNLAEDQRQRLLEIANKCPVHKLLTSQVEVQTSLT